eukprot:COSAG01_NODE_188_length_22632_cov_15.284915_16_plen_132_part_00
MRRLIASVEPADGPEANWNWRNSLEEGLDICGTLKRRGHHYNGHPVSECESKHNNPSIQLRPPLCLFVQARSSICLPVGGPLLTGCCSVVCSQGLLRFLRSAQSIAPQPPLSPRDHPAPAPNHACTLDHRA